MGGQRGVDLSRFDSRLVLLFRRSRRALLDFLRAYADLRESMVERPEVFVHYSCRGGRRQGDRVEDPGRDLHAPHPETGEP